MLKISLTNTQRLLKKDVGDIHEILKEDPTFPKPIRRGARTYFYEKEVLIWYEKNFNNVYQYNTNSIQNRTIKILAIAEDLEDYIKKFAIPLLHIAADTGSNEELKKAVGVLIWKLERTTVKHSSKIFLDLIGQGFTDVQKDEIKRIYKEIAEKISSQTLPSAFYDFMKSTMSEDESTIITRIIKSKFVSFLRTYFKVRYVNGVLSYWNGVKYVRGRGQFISLIHNICYFFEINSFQSLSTFVNQNFIGIYLKHIKV